MSSQPLDPSDLSSVNINCFNAPHSTAALLQSVQPILVFAPNSGLYYSGTSFQVFPTPAFLTQGGQIQPIFGDSGGNFVSPVNTAGFHSLPGQFPPSEGLATMASSTTQGNAAPPAVHTHDTHKTLHQVTRKEFSAGYSPRTHSEEKEKKMEAVPTPHTSEREQGGFSFHVTPFHSPTLLPAVPLSSLQDELTSLPTLDNYDLHVLFGEDNLPDVADGFLFSEEEISGQISHGEDLRGSESLGRGEGSELHLSCREQLNDHKSNSDLRVDSRPPPLDATNPTAANFEKAAGQRSGSMAAAGPQIQASDDCLLEVLSTRGSESGPTLLSLSSLLPIGRPVTRRLSQELLAQKDKTEVERLEALHGGRRHRGSSNLANLLTEMDEFMAAKRDRSVSTEAMAKPTASLRKKKQRDHLLPLTKGRLRGKTFTMDPVLLTAVSNIFNAVEEGLVVALEAKLPSVQPPSADDSVLAILDKELSNLVDSCTFCPHVSYAVSSLVNQPKRTTATMNVEPGLRSFARKLEQFKQALKELVEKQVDAPISRLKSRVESTKWQYSINSHSISKLNLLSMQVFDDAASCARTKACEALRKFATTMASSLMQGSNYEEKGERESLKYSGRDRATLQSRINGSIRLVQGMYTDEVENLGSAERRVPRSRRCLSKSFRAEARRGLRNGDDGLQKDEEEGESGLKISSRREKGLSGARGELPQAAADFMRAWLIDHWDKPYPSRKEKQRMSEACLIGVKQVEDWMVNARARLWKPLTLEMVREMQE